MLEVSIIFFLYLIFKETVLDVSNPRGNKNVAHFFSSLVSDF